MNEKAAIAQNPLGSEPIGKLMWRFSIPAILSFLVNSLYNIIDQIFIGQGLGELGMAATNVSFPLVTICTGAALLLGVGGASNFNLSLGRKQPEKAANIAGNALFMMALSGIVISVLAIVFLNPLLKAFGAIDSIMKYARPYTLIVAIGFPFMIFSSGAAQLIRADGSPRFSMIVVLAGAIFNVIFDPVFMFGFNMGIDGIALATTLGQVLSSALALFYILRRFKSVPLKKECIKPKLLALKPICALGAAACVNQLAMTVVQIVKNNSMRHFGEISAIASGAEDPQLIVGAMLAAVGAITKIGIVFLSVILGVSQGCQPIISFNYGSKNYSRVRQTVKLALIITSVMSVLSFLSYQIFPNQIMSIFGSGSGEYMDFAVKYLRIFMFMTFLNFLQPQATYLFTSIGKASLGMWMSMTRQLILLVPLLIFLPMISGVDGILYAGPVSDGIAAILASLLIFREFRKIKALEAQS